ncbi:transcriptional regulator GcvA [Azospirillum sp. A1-3]|uniref:transcriptional regulator GcvA n=1 Tax=Azospirillum sp. A1-3 TaxID=185874 RepID=UPI002076E2EA|nr:transcriptional regulator GcvA [Azospirillum sp. A1-3]MCM8733172.1 transcriptional regulator GcvA [Azospirillum sp. A1-3]
MTNQLPPLQTLRAFEATGRRLSMTLAAEELHVTHGAVSRQIKALEEHLGVQLFRRMTRRIEFSAEGAAFFAVVTRLLSELSRETESIRRRNETARLVVSSGVSFASKWLTPRLHRLMDRYPTYDVQLEVTDVEIDFAKSQTDVAMRYGNGRYPNAESERIMNETVSPVCSPGYRERMGGLRTAKDIASARLIHENGMKADWHQWFGMMGIPTPAARGPGYSHGSMSIEAAIRGEGVALGRSVLVSEDIAAGRLVALFPEARLDVEHGYDLVYPMGQRDHPKVCAVRAWIKDEVEQFKIAVEA